MRKLLILLFWVPATALAQDDVQKEINEQVWIPFIKAYRESDGELLASLHTDDAVRVRQDGGSVDSGLSFLQSRIDSMARAKERGGAEMQLRLKKRFHNEDSAYEIGYYAVRTTSNFFSYGEFTVLLKKIDGRWRIAMDADKASTREEFMTGDQLLIHKLEGPFKPRGTPGR